MNWSGCRNILIIRPDNMGDLLMSSPAIRALKETFNCRITVLTSSLGAEAATLIPEIDETIVSPVGWVRNKKAIGPEEMFSLGLYLKSRSFDAAVVFNVYSQNPLPSAMLAWMAGIPKRLAYCRENPYELINYWIPDKEPFTCILHQVERDLELVKHIGVKITDDHIRLHIEDSSIDTSKIKLAGLIPNVSEYVVIHAGVSELKRAYPNEKWVELARAVSEKFGLPIIFTGSKAEKPLTEKLQKETGDNSYSAAGLFDIPELAALIKGCRLLISVNTGPVHIAAGLK
ncbi:MAG: glycosyltransferase family 9 protein, partial [Chloroflexota bacterium]